MEPFTALLLVTPLFGLSLTPPPAALAPSALSQAVSQPAAFAAALPPLQVEAAGADEGAAPSDEAEESDDADGAQEADEGISREQYGAMMRQRADIATIHKPLGIATWASMLMTLTLGFFQWHNLYGPFQSLEDTPCVTGDGIIFGESQCSGTPWVHLSSAMLTTALYATTFTLSLMMPDPDGLDEGEGAYASNLRTHKALRWVHFVGMVSQLALGIVIANAESFGMDRANDYDTLQALSAVHMGLGVVTFGALTWSGAMFLF
ncbi:MAG: hypothetical protein DRJ42_18390 [Deltaproteobacteria bacterium]|nr:MAG: hypothetical protein DRJ42_18390 [Deltaproteobacteria bacterium]